MALFSLNTDPDMHARSLILVLVAGLAFTIASTLAQTVEGKVELSKQPVERIANQRYQVKPDMSVGLPDPPVAVIYLEGDFPKPTNAAGRLFAEMAQKNISFAPGLLAIQVGTTVEFPNLDDTYHNVFSYSKAKRFDLGRYRKDEKPGLVVFDKSGVVTLHCEIHGTMRGTILVLDTPYFQKTSASGEFRLKGLPTGHYLLKAWVNENDVREQPADLKAGATIHIDFPAK